MGVATRKRLGLGLGLGSVVGSSRGLGILEGMSLPSLTFRLKGPSGWLGGRERLGALSLIHPGHA